MKTNKYAFARELFGCVFWIDFFSLIALLQWEAELMKVIALSLIHAAVVGVVGNYFVQYIHKEIVQSETRLVEDRCNEKLRKAGLL